MQVHTPPPVVSRIFSPDKKNWVDVIDKGEYRMNAVQKEFITSFQIEGANSFPTIDGECFFKDSNIFVLWSPEKVLVYHINEKVALHLTADEMDEEFLFFEIIDLQSAHPKLEINWENKATDSYDFYASFQLLKPGRGFA